MRRSYISPEFDHNNLYGTFNMVEESNFFGAKMLEIEDYIYISTQNIIYYQNSNGEQIDLSSESILDSNIYSSSDSKKSYHTLKLDETQSSYTKDNSTRWIMNIGLSSILSDFLYAEMKRYRSFEGIKNNMTVNNDVNSALKNYISNNVLNRYKFSKIELFLEYKDLRSNSLLKLNNTWDNLSYKSENQLTKFETETQYDGSNIRVTFNQEKPSTLYNFNYYFNILFEKI
jgi:hypothetical protein